MTSGESVTLAFNDSYLSIIGAALGIVTKKVEEHRAEMGELTVDEVKSAFTPTVTALGRDINEYDFEKLSRGVWKVVDVDGDDNGVQTHYVVIKHSGETTVVPFSATEGINWGSDLTDWIKGIRQKYSQ
jgi:ribonucleotide reductase alpha subunit